MVLREYIQEVKYGEYRDGFYWLEKKINHGGTEKEKRKLKCLYSPEIIQAAFCL